MCGQAAEAGANMSIEGNRSPGPEDHGLLPLLSVANGWVQSSQAYCHVTVCTGRRPIGWRKRKSLIKVIKVQAAALWSGFARKQVPALMLSSSSTSNSTTLIFSSRYWLPDLALEASINNITYLRYIPALHHSASPHTLNSNLAGQAPVGKHEMQTSAASMLSGARVMLQ